MKQDLFGGQVNRFLLTLKNRIMKKFLIALPSFPNAKGFCHSTILLSGNDENEVISRAMELKPYSNIGEIKEVQY